MLRSVNTVVFNLSSISLTVTHGLGQIPDAWNVTHQSAAAGTVGNTAAGQTYIPAASVLTNALTAYNSHSSAVTVVILTVFYNGRLY